MTDRRGHFAMGTPDGTRTRKYHGFFSGIAGRLEKNLIAQLDLRIQDRPLWAYWFESPSGPPYRAPPDAFLRDFKSRPWPRWSWTVPEGSLSAELRGLEAGGFEFRLQWSGTSESLVSVRPLWASRPLHALGGRETLASPEAGLVRFSGGLRIACDRPFEWRPEQSWWRGFVYLEEQTRGYDAREDLFSAGRFELKLTNGGEVSFYLLPEDAEKTPRALDSVEPLEDFAVVDPPGVVAGYPWFGEWGRDTFISLPGIVAGARSLPPEWPVGVLERWGDYLRDKGMLPNVITPEGPQWDSSDATLWWTHALASLWALGLVPRLEERFLEPLDIALHSIESGKHRHLRFNDESGLVAVTTEHTTWMDARVDGAAVTPRTGYLPEINALWLQARCLRSIWSREKGAALLSLAHHALALENEMNRPNIVFLHSLPLAPSFVARDASSMTRDAAVLCQELATPTGLRTLSPRAPGYIARYEGDQRARDLAYHQGPAWGWLRGHYDMAVNRFRAAGISFSESADARALARDLSPIDGHFAELFDAEKPWEPKGAPAQAWSLACAAEARERRLPAIDRQLRRRLSEVLT